MSHFFRDPTAGAAIGAVDKELALVHKTAAKLRNLRKKGLLTPEREAEALSGFSGLFRRVLENDLNKPD